MRRLASALLVLTPLAAAAGCADTAAAGAPAVRGGGPVARATLVEGWGCTNTQAGVVEVPEHCAWPPALSRAPILSADVQVVASVGPRGEVVDVRIVRGPPDGKFDEAALACARRVKYRVPATWTQGAASADTCPLTLRLARYVTDLDPRQRDCPPSMYSVVPVGQVGQGSMPGGDSNPLGCP